MLVRQNPVFLRKKRTQCALYIMRYLSTGKPQARDNSDWAPDFAKGVIDRHPIGTPKIRQIGDDFLRRVATPVSLRNIYEMEMTNILQAMLYWIRKARACGLTAPHLGVDQRIIGVHFTSRDLARAVNKYGIYGACRKEFEILPLKFYFNPEISKIIDERKILHWESCSCIKGFSALVPRYKSVEIKAINRSGGRIRFTVAGEVAARFQHEIDHLNGVLMTDIMIPRTLTKIGWEKKF